MGLVERAKERIAAIRDREVRQIVRQALAEDDRWCETQCHDGGGFKPDAFEAFFPEHGPDAVGAAWYHYRAIRSLFVRPPR